MQLLVPDAATPPEIDGASTPHGAGLVPVDAVRPITVLALQLEVLKRAVRAETREEALGAIGRSVRELRSLLEDARDTALLDAGDLRVVRARTDLARIAERVAARTRDAAAARGVGVEVRGPTELAVHVDDRLVERALHGLVARAGTRAASGGRVHLALFAEPDGARVLVRHDGADADAPVSSAFRVARRIAAAHGGELRRHAGDPGAVGVEMTLRSVP